MDLADTMAIINDRVRDSTMTSAEADALLREIVHTPTDQLADQLINCDVPTAEHLQEMARSFLASAESDPDTQGATGAAAEDAGDDTAGWFSSRLPGELAALAATPTDEAGRGDYPADYWEDAAPGQDTNSYGDSDGD